MSPVKMERGHTEETKEDGVPFGGWPAPVVSRRLGFKSRGDGMTNLYEGPNNFACLNATLYTFAIVAWYPWRGMARYQVLSLSTGSRAASDKRVKLDTEQRRLAGQKVAVVPIKLQT